MGNVGATGGNDYANNNISPVIDLNNALEIEMEHSPRQETLQSINELQSFFDPIDLLERRFPEKDDEYI